MRVDRIRVCVLFMRYCVGQCIATTHYAGRSRNMCVCVRIAAPHTHTALTCYARRDEGKIYAAIKMFRIGRTVVADGFVFFCVRCRDTIAAAKCPLLRRSGYFV